MMKRSSSSSKIDSCRVEKPVAVRAFQKLKRVFVRAPSSTASSPKSLKTAFTVSRLPRIPSAVSSNASSRASTAESTSNYSKSTGYSDIDDELVLSVESTRLENSAVAASVNSENIEYVVVHDQSVVSNIPPVMLPPLHVLPPRASSALRNRSSSAMRNQPAVSNRAGPQHVSNAVIAAKPMQATSSFQRSKTPTREFQKMGVSNSQPPVVKDVQSQRGVFARTESVSSTTSSTSTCSTASFDMESLLFPPAGYDFSIEQVVSVVEKLALELIEQTPRLRPHDAGYNEFGRDPVFKPREFCEMFLNRSRTSPLCILVGMFYLRTMLQTHPKLKVSSNNASRLVLVACAGAAKFVDDVSMRYTNEHWIRIGGSWLSLQKFNSMEREFMSLMSWNLSVDPTRFQSFCAMYGLGIWIPSEGLPHSMPSPTDR